MLKATASVKAASSTAPEKPQWRKQWWVEGETPQRHRSAELAVPRRQRLVEDTLQVVRDCCDQTKGLEDAARVAAAEVRAAEAAHATQEALCSVLAKPRCPWVNQRPTAAAEEEPTPESLPPRSAVEQRLACDGLARPRERLTPPRLPFLPPGAEPAARTAEEQQQRCSQLAQAKVREPLLEATEGEEAAVRWRMQLAARAAEPTSVEVEAARRQLAEMSSRRAAERGVPTSRPTSAISRHRAADAASGGASRLHVSPEFGELRAVVEELLWVVLLQQRSCPKRATKEASRPAAGAGAGARDELAERLEGLLLDAVGPALRPVARRVLAPSARLARQARAEFPRLAAHLGFRESDDDQPASSSWSVEDVVSLTAEVRACRDRVLGSELTKILSQCQA